MEHSSLLVGSARVKFNTKFAGPSTGFARRYSREVSDLSEALTAIENLGVAPIAPDGKIAGNGAIRLSDVPNPVLLVSKSGKEQGIPATANDMVFVTNFDEASWSAIYFAASPDIRPSSDTPLLWTALLGNNGWDQFPKIALHGHAFETEQAAKLLNAPISSQETMFSTVEDLEALRSIFYKHPYGKECKLYLRKGHGFFALSDTMHEAVEDIKNMCKQRDSQ